MRPACVSVRMYHRPNKWMKRAIFRRSGSVLFEVELCKTTCIRHTTEIKPYARTAYVLLNLLLDKFYLPNDHLDKETDPALTKMDTA